MDVLAKQYKRLMNQNGQTMVEYVFLVMLLAMVIYGALLVFGPALTDAYMNIVNAF